MSAGVVPQPGLATQFPARHCLPAAQMVVSAALPVIWHTWVPEVHTVAPILQTVPGGVQDVPAVHDTQLPPLQTRLVPQLAPFARFVP